MEEITIKIPQEVAETLDLFVASLNEQNIQTNTTELASIMLTDWCAKSAADTATLGESGSDVYALRPKRVGDKYHLDTEYLFRFLKSDYMMENLSRADERFREKIWQWQREKYLEGREEVSLEELHRLQDGGNDDTGR